MSKSKPFFGFYPENPPMPFNPDSDQMKQGPFFLVFSVETRCIASLHYDNDRIDSSTQNQSIPPEREPPPFWRGLGGGHWEIVLKISHKQRNKNGINRYHQIG